MEAIGGGKPSLDILVPTLLLKENTPPIPPKTQPQKYPPEPKIKQTPNQPEKKSTGCLTVLEGNNKKEKRDSFFMPPSAQVAGRFPVPKLQPQRWELVLHVGKHHSKSWK